MTNPGFGAPTAQAPSHPGAAVVGPCGPARAEVDVRCADAERVLAAAQTHQNTLREARRQQFEASRLRESDNSVRDRRALGEEKAAAQAEYHEAVNRAVDLSSVQAAAAAWMARINQLNHASRTADDRADAPPSRSAIWNAPCPAWRWRPMRRVSRRRRLKRAASSRAARLQRARKSPSDEERLRLPGRALSRRRRLPKHPQRLCKTAGPPPRGQRIMRGASRRPER